MRGLQIRAKELGAAQQQLEEEQKVVVALERIFESATQQVALASEALQAARNSTEQTRRVLIDTREQILRAEEIRNLRNARVNLFEELSACGELVQQLNARIATLSEQIAVAHQRVGEVETQQKATASAASAHARLTSLVTQLKSLVNELQMTSCPVCGHQYENRLALLSHIEKTALLRIDHDLDLVRLTDVLEESRSSVAELGERIEQTSRDLETAIQNRRRLSDELSRLDDRVSVLTAQSAQTVLQNQIEELEQQVRASEQTLTQAENSFSDAQSAFGSAESRLLGARERLAVVRSRFERLSFQPSESTSPNLEQAERARSAQQEQKDEAQAQYEAQAALCEKLAFQVNSLRGSLQTERARLAQSEQRLTSLESELRQHARRLGLSDDPAQGNSNAADAARQLTQEEELLREATDELEMIVSADRYRAAAIELKAVELKKGSAQANLDEIVLAQARFNELAGLIEQRSASEARSSVRHLRAAIQESFSALYPHNHLDQVRLSRSDVLLYDSDLATPVQPYFYTSTGQLNVLALSMFMGVALRQQICRLGFIMLDEPVQNLSDVQFLAFIMFVKRVALNRQVILSTADNNIAELFRRQMISGAWRNGDSQYAQFEWKSFDPFTGPTFLPVPFPSAAPRTGSVAKLVEK